MEHTVYKSYYGDYYFPVDKVPDLYTGVGLLYEEAGIDADEALLMYRGTQFVELTEHPAEEHEDECYDAEGWEICERSVKCQVFERVPSD